MANSSVEDFCPYGHRCQPLRIDTIGDFVIYHYQCGKCGAVWTVQTPEPKSPDQPPGD